MKRPITTGHGVGKVYWSPRRTRQCWYDRRTRSWVCYAVDAFGNQIEDSYHTSSRSDAMGTLFDSNVPVRPPLEQVFANPQTRTI